MYFYRISAYCFLVGTTVIITLFIAQAKIGSEPDLASLLFACLMSYCVLNYFVDLHPNVAEGVQISYLIEESLGRQERQKPGEVIGADRFDYKYEIKSMEKNYQDGTFC